MRIFVTGSTGVVGRRAIPLLVALGHEVTAAIRGRTRGAELREAGATTTVLDLFDAGAVARALEGHAAVVNLATHVPSSGNRMFLPGAWRENDRIRREASAILAATAIRMGMDRFVQESFAPIYPDLGERWIDETVPPRPARYNRSTLDAEAAAARVTAAGGTGVVLRFGGFYGPDAFHVHEMMEFVRRGLAPMLGPPDAFFSSVSHDDAATAVVAALGLPAGIYNVVDDEPLRHREYVDSLAAALGVAPPRMLPAWLRYLGGSVGETLARSLRISNRKLREVGGWSPRYPSVREGWRAVLQEIDSVPAGG